MSSPSFDPGAVHVRALWQDGRASKASVRVARPTAAAALRGRPADEAVRLLPLLYAICGTAQGVAARHALAAARGEAQKAAVDAAVLAEAQREHLWRLLLDWPQTLGMGRQEALLLAARKSLQGGGAFAVPLPDGLRRHLAALEHALRSLPQAELSEDPLLPPLTAAETVALWPRLDAAFAAQPEYCDAPASTGALARHPRLASLGPVAGRVMARVADLAAPEGLGRVDAATVERGVGRAVVETARGLLLHEIVLEDDRVVDYAIVAPTEWNFHPAGTLKRLLEKLAAKTPGELKAAMTRAVLAFDPCVRYEIEVATEAEPG